MSPSKAGPFMRDTAGKLFIAGRPPFTIISKDGAVRVEVGSFDGVRTRYHDLVDAQPTPEQVAVVDGAYWAAISAVEQYSE